MFDVTYLGHQGWLIESATARILVDPLLGGGFGNMPEDALDVYPPRRIDLAGFPPIDAVIATHEHADHLSLPSLFRLAPSIPVFLPARASTAARSIVRDLGFRLELLGTGEKATIGDLEVHSFPSVVLTRDEWDVRPLLIRDRAGDGSLATSIDAPESTEFARFSLERAGKIGLWASSHNGMDLFPLRAGAAQEDGALATVRLTRAFAKRFEQNFGHGARPSVLAVLASGMSFKGDLAWMNRHVFPGPPADIAAALRPDLRDVSVCAPLPGHRFSFSGGDLAHESEARPFLATLDRDRWPPHAAERYEGTLPDFAPASGHCDFSPDDLAGLLDALKGFAGHLYGGDAFRSLYASGDDAFAPRRPTVGFAARTASQTLTLAYRPDACAFELVPGGDPERELVAGLGCWASDLLAILRFDLFCGYLLGGRYRKWNAAPEHVRCDLDTNLSLYLHPLRHPDPALRLYRRAAEKLAPAVGAEIRVRSAGG